MSVKKLRKLYDIIVDGADPAGAAAALHAARQGAGVLVLDRASSSGAREGALDWLGPAGVELCKECGVGVRKAGAGAFKGLRMHSWDFRRSATVGDAEAFGWIVDQTVLTGALLTAASKKGADILSNTSVSELILAEDRVVCGLKGGGEAVGKLLLVSGELACSTARMANLASAGREREAASCLAIEYDVASKATGLDLAVGANRAGQIAVVLRFNQRVSLKLVSRTGDTPIEQQFESFRAQALAAGLLPERMDG